MSSIRPAIDLVGVEGFEEAYPRELSGGMKQRVGIARAMVMQRPVLLLDEPFSALDVLTADTLRAEMVKIFLDKKTSTSSMVMVTHNIQEAVFMAQRILVMGTNPGHIRREIVNDLPYPRDDSQSRVSPDGLPDSRADHRSPHARRRPPPPGRPCSQGTPKEPPIETIPNVQISELIGLLEVISAQGGAADIFELAHDIAKDFGSTLYLVKAAELLDLVETPKQRVILTEIGRHFIDGDINVRKRMLH